MTSFGPHVMSAAKTTSPIPVYTADNIAVNEQPFQMRSDNPEANLFRKAMHANIVKSTGSDAYALRFNTHLVDDSVKSQNLRQSLKGDFVDSPKSRETLSSIHHNPDTESSSVVDSGMPTQQDKIEYRHVRKSNREPDTTNIPKDSSTVANYTKKWMALKNRIRSDDPSIEHVDNEARIEPSQQCEIANNDVPATCFSSQTTEPNNQNPSPTITPLKSTHLFRHVVPDIRRATLSVRRHEYHEHRSSLEMRQRSSTIETDRVNAFQHQNVQQVNQYRMLKPLGRGAFGTVCMARNVETGQACAIKCISKKRMRRATFGRRPLPPSTSTGGSTPASAFVCKDCPSHSPINRGREYAIQSRGTVSNPVSPSSCHQGTSHLRSYASATTASQSPISTINATVLSEMEREIEILKHVSHKHIVQLFEIINDPNHDIVYMAMELLPGGPVMSMTKPEGQTPLPEMHALKYFRQIIQGLCYLHHQRIVHRDLKPSNILLLNDDVVKITDFGVSYMFDVSETGFLLYDTKGTPAFMAPECLDPRTPITGFDARAADVWALGVTLYCFLYGRIPFRGTTKYAIYNTIRSQEIDFRDDHLRRPLSHEVVELLQCMLNKDETQRITMSKIYSHVWTNAFGESLLMPYDAPDLIQPNILVTDTTSIQSDQKSISSFDRNKEDFNQREKQISPALSLSLSSRLGPSQGSASTQRPSSPLRTETAARHVAEQSEYTSPLRQDSTNESVDKLPINSNIKAGLSPGPTCSCDTSLSTEYMPEVSECTMRCRTADATQGHARRPHRRCSGQSISAPKLNIPARTYYPSHRHGPSVITHFLSSDTDKHKHENDGADQLESDLSHITTHDLSTCSENELEGSEQLFDVSVASTTSNDSNVIQNDGIPQSNFAMMSRRIPNSTRTNEEYRRDAGLGSSLLELPRNEESYNCISSGDLTSSANTSTHSEMMYARANPSNSLQLKNLRARQQRLNALAMSGHVSHL